MLCETVRGASRPRSKRARQHDVSTRRASRTLIILVTAILLPVIAMVVLNTKTIEPDLFDLTPIVSRLDQQVVLAWAELERPKNALKADQPSSGTRIRALGYMMEGARPAEDGERVQRFVLLPDAGSSVHPAHRFGDQMIDVQLKAGNEVRFCARSLVWVWGTLRTLHGDPFGHDPLYVLENARTEPANKADIQKYFR